MIRFLAKPTLPCLLRTSFMKSKTKLIIKLTVSLIYLFLGIMWLVNQYLDFRYTFENFYVCKWNKVIQIITMIAIAVYVLTICFMWVNKQLCKRDLVKHAIISELFCFCIVVLWYFATRDVMEYQMIENTNCHGSFLSSYLYFFSLYITLVLCVILSFKGK